MNVVTLRDIARQSERLADAGEVDLPAACAFTNASGARREGLDLAYAARIARPEAIDLVCVPAASLRGDNFRLIVSGAIVREQCVPHQLDNVTHGVELKGSAEIRDAVLIARYGDGTWGHWIGELLPKAALLERIYPGRFNYLMPDRILARRDVLAIRVAEAFAAYGVMPDRMIPLRRDTQYRCNNLLAVTPVWTDRMLHPAASVALRRLDPTDGDKGRFALLRDDTRRAIENMDQVVGVLADFGFRTIDIAKLSFAEQVATFRNAEAVFSVLGSTLAGLVYAQRGVRVVAVTPEPFMDAFFYSMTQQRGGIYAEVRGPLATDDASIPRDNPFTVPLDALRTAMESCLHHGVKAAEHSQVPLPVL